MQKRYDQNPCPNCGQPKRKVAETCAACYNKRRTLVRPACIDCGGPLGDKGLRAKRCWNCHLKQRLSQPKKACSVEGCPHPHKAKGYCVDHYQKFVQQPLNRDGAGRNFLSWIRAQPCQLCGYNRLHSHAHRLTGGKDGGTYEWGNVVALCARCHEEIHRGLTEPPPALLQLTHISTSA